MLRVCVVLALLVVMVMGQGRTLLRPDPESCKNRIKHAATFRNGHYYFFSWLHGPTQKHERDWLDARNICRKHCQDLVSIETQEENTFVKNALSEGNVKYIWTSGRKCNFDGCDRPDLKPTIINGWFWSGSGKRIPPTNSKAGWNGDWSRTGGGNQPQPDNREFRETGNDEACIAILNNFYNDGVVWHDVACHHVKPWICEDSEELLAFARSSDRSIP
ncbi:L-selectin-like [Homarus americanus]|uniref:L-selectin-like n=1 Tax=Homarus americanus TaxID=6706 RepID=UPI001C452DC6|nr:L-selectin-like [Homarus americanus]XP_042235145.1 L-selectin-like [Homarus americanus]